MRAVPRRRRTWVAEHRSVEGVEKQAGREMASGVTTQWRNDGVAAASSDGGPTGGRRPPTVLEFLVINFSVCLVLSSNCYIIIYCMVLVSSSPVDGCISVNIFILSLL